MLIGGGVAWLHVNNGLLWLHMPLFGRQLAIMWRILVGYSSVGDDVIFRRK